MAVEATLFPELINKLCQLNSLESALFHAEQHYASHKSAESTLLLAQVCLRMKRFEYIVRILGPLCSIHAINNSLPKLAESSPLEFAVVLKCFAALAEAHLELQQLDEARFLLDKIVKQSRFSSSADSSITGGYEYILGHLFVLSARVHKANQNGPLAVESYRKALLHCPLMFEALSELAALQGVSVSEGMEMNIFHDDSAVFHAYQALLNTPTAPRALFGPSSTANSDGIEDLQNNAVQTAVQQAKEPKKSKLLSSSSATSPSKRSQSTRSASIGAVSSTIPNLTNQRGSTETGESLRVLRERKRNRCGEFLNESPSASQMDIDKEPSAKHQSTVDYNTHWNDEEEYKILHKFAGSYNECAKQIVSVNMYTGDPNLHCSDFEEVSAFRKLRARHNLEKQKYKTACLDFEWLLQHGFYCESASYSTALWHLKDLTQLSALAQSLMNTHRQSAFSWCVLGNCFSLQKRHEDALTCFERAVTIDATYGYAHNLAGHEHMATEAYDNALTSFRKAIQYAPKLYNAWYGLALVYYRQEKWVQALAHFEQAVLINSSSSILYCFRGMALTKLHRFQEALENFDYGIELDGNNPQIRYRKAMLLVETNHLDLAMKELFKVADLAPKELNVYFRIGQIHAKTGDKQRALEMYLKAMDGHNSTIKDAIEQLAL